MTHYTFDPSRLRGSPEQQERAGYAFAAQLLREPLGGNPLAEFRRRAQRDPVLQAMFAQAAAELLAAAYAIEDELERRR